MKNLIFSLFFVCLFSSLIQAQELSVVTEDLPPYNYEQQGEIVGFGTEVVKATLEKAGIIFKIRLYPWARAYQMALKEKNILIYTIVRNTEREKLFKWVGPFAPRQSAIIYKLKERTDIIVNSLNDVKKYELGLVRDDATHLFFKKHGFTRINLVVSEEQNIKMLFRKRMEIIAGNELVAAYKMKQIGYQYNQVEKVFTFSHGGGYYMGISRGTSDDITIRIREAFDQIKRDGTLEIIKRKYLGD